MIVTLALGALALSVIFGGMAAVADWIDHGVFESNDSQGPSL